MVLAVTHVSSRVVVKNLGGNPPRLVATKYVTYHVTRYISAPKMIISTLITNIISRITAVTVNYYLGSQVYTRMVIPTDIATTKTVTHIVTKTVTSATPSPSRGGGAATAVPT